MAPQFVVVFPLTTTLTISSLPTPQPTALESFLPLYNARPDGSLITSQYMREVKDTNARLFMAGFLLMLFIRNAVVSIDYLYRSRSKDKTLFYLLVASQMLGPLCFISLAVSYLSATANCTVLYTTAIVSTAISDSILITGILGIKAYRCLDRSRIVLFVLVLFQISSTGVLCYDVSRLRSHRTASGTCDTVGDFQFPVSILLLFIQSFFICLCFVYTVWKASPYPVAQGRLSLAVSLETDADDCDCPIPLAPSDLPERRGWWDYVPEHRHDQTQDHRNTPDNQSVFSHVSRLFSLASEPQSTVPQRKSSIPSLKPLPHPRRSEFRLSEKSQPPPPVRNDASSHRQRRGGRITRIRFVRAAMQKELFHTAAVTVNGLVAVILIIVGFTKLDLLWIPMVWLGVNWMVTSLIVMHSFSMVVKRHEREAILREPNTWDSMALHARREGRRPTSLPISFTSYRPSRRHVDTEAWSRSYSSWNEDPFRSPQEVGRRHEDVETFRDVRCPSDQCSSAQAVDACNAESSSPPPTPGIDFLPNHYPERVVPQPLESPPASPIRP